MFVKLFNTSENIKKGLCLLLVVVALVTVCLPITASAQSFDEYLGLINQERQKLGQPPVGPGDPVPRTGQPRFYDTLVNRWEAAQREGPEAVKALMDAARANVENPRASKPASCAGTWDKLVNPGECLIRVAFAGIGSLFMWIGVKAVVLAGGIFEFVLKHAVVEFGKTLQAIESGINNGWTALRDIANIVIIGLFVFIAVNIILGVKEFGDKKKVAQVLIVAVLINFSLLFTKVIVDASNFTAFQFYNSMTKQQSPDSGVGITPTDSSLATAAAASGIDETKVTGIAGRFLKLLGVEGIGDSYNLIRDAQENQKSALAGLGYGLLMLIFLLASAFVFLYGAFLIVSRAILIIFLMLTSALAFASWLIPQNYIEKGFAKWWESLLKTAFFAPILMALLWVAVIVSDALVNKGKFGEGGSLGKLAVNAAADGNLGAVFNFIIVLGMLFAAFAVSNAFSKTISGFKYAQKGVGFAAFTPLAAASRVVGFAGRGLIGGMAGAGVNRLKAAGYTADSVLGRTLFRPLFRAAESSFDVMNTKAVRKTSAALGGYTFGEEVGKGGYLGVKRRQAEELDKIARAMAPSADARERLANAARVRENATVNQERAALDRQLATAQAAQQNAQQQVPQARTQAEQQENTRQEQQRGPRVALEQARTTAATDRTNMEQQRDTRRAQFQQEMAIEQQRIATAARGSQEEAAARQNYSALDRDMNTEMQQFTQSISTAQQQFDTHNQALADWDNAVQTSANQEEERVIAPHRQAVQELTDEIIHLEQERAPRREFARQERNLQLQAPAISEAMARNKLTIGREEIVRQLGGARERHGLRQLASQLGESGGRPPAPPAPPPQQGTP